MAALVALAGEGALGFRGAEAGGAWPQFRGPDRDGAAHGEREPGPWPPDGPREVWRRGIGEGYSGLAVVDGVLYTLATEGEQELALAFDAASGEELWRRPIGGRFEEEFGDGPRSTPTVAGGRVFALGGQGRLSALDAADGTLRWRVELTEAFGSSTPQRGFAASPLLDGDLLLLPVGGGEGLAYAALDAATGQVEWTAGDGGPGYSSLIAMTVGGARQYLAADRDAILALSPAGEILWRYPWLPGTIASPLAVAPDRVFVSASYDVGAVLLDLAAPDEAGVPSAVWRNRTMKNHFNSSVRHGDHVYGFDNATLKSLSLATGDQAWAKRGFGKGSLILVGSRLLVLSDRGRLALVPATPEGYREEASFQALSGKCWTAPAFADGRLYLRNQTEMASLELTPPARPEE